MQAILIEAVNGGQLVEVNLTQSSNTGKLFIERKVVLKKAINSSIVIDLELPVVILNYSAITRSPKSNFTGKKGEWTPELGLLEVAMDVEFYEKAKSVEKEVKAAVLPPSNVKVHFPNEDNNYSFNVEFTQRLHMYDGLIESLKKSHRASHLDN